MRITLVHPDNAPNFCYVIRADDGRERFIQTDTDYPGTASSFGWSLSTVRPKELDQMELDELEPAARVQYDKQCTCDHSGTDGTVNCRDCGLTAGDFIGAAGQFLSDNEGATADDPGYFD
jgi:hypothetical protein